jgi:hypothetical protein
LLVKQIFRLRTPRSGLSGGFLAKGW